VDGAYRVVRLDQVEAAEDFGGQHFKPVRILLGIQAFGVAAWVADAGEAVIGEHTEPDGQEELYVVLAGRVLFTVDGQEFAADEGTCVSVRPSARRSARADADGAVVLAVGATVGKPYAAPGWEHGVGAAADYRRGDYERAAEILRAADAEHPDTVGVLYNLACCEALIGRGDDAIGHLQAALALQPELAAHAQHDSDLDAIRADPRFPAVGG
jgi:mannose-6-phosphate isomerase-like protein (cupin superfamily)